MSISFYVKLRSTFFCALFNVCINPLFCFYSGFKVLEVIAGNATAYVHTTNIKKWDICAGNAIIKAAGGEMTTLDNKQIDYSSTSNSINTGGLLATLGLRHNELAQKLSRAKL